MWSGFFYFGRNASLFPRLYYYAFFQLLSGIVISKVLDHDQSGSRMNQMLRLKQFKRRKFNTFKLI